jgi:hypothetical protein
MRVESADVIDADVALKLLPRLASLLEEVGAEPDLLQVRLVGIFGEDLLDGHLPLGGPVNAQPHHAETASAQQSHPLEVLGESLAELAVLIGSEVAPHVEAALVAIFIVDVNGFLLSVLAVAQRLPLLHAAALLLLLDVDGLLPGLFLALPIEQLF